MDSSFKALVLDQDDGATTAEVRDLSLDDLPDNDIHVKVHYSTLNYKDALAITGKGKVIRDFPIVPGIDLSGEIVDPGSSNLSAGDQVVSTGWGMGERYWGGLSQYARISADWPLTLPEGIDTRSAMVLGTGGFTAALCVIAIVDREIKPEDGPVLVTGAGGGVGGVAVMLLSALGYEVHALSGRESLNDYLRQIGASTILPREELSRESKPLERETWAAVVDTVGGEVLATAIAQTKSEGVVSACGNAGGIGIKSTVFPFILRGVTLRGINSVTAPKALRERAWAMLAEHMSPELLSLLTDREISLNEVLDTCEVLLAGNIRGRVIVNLQP
ncbi:MAG TPA: MDR family oxidoreductase [Gammaproteobacteria bacterium]